MRKLSQLQKIMCQMKCRKCDKSSCIVARQKDPFCKDCFNSYFEHKFRATFGKYRMIEKGEIVLVPLSGGRCSSVLKHLIDITVKKDFKTGNSLLNFKPIYLYIDDYIPTLGKQYDSNCSYFDSDNLSNEKQCTCYISKNINKILDMYRPLIDINSLFITFLDIVHYNYDEKFTNNERILPLFTDVSQYLKIRHQFVNNTPHESPLNLLLNLPNNKYPFRKTLIKIIKKNIVVNACSHLKIKKALMGDYNTLIATELMSSLIMGAGAQMSNQVTFSQSVGGVTIVRPLKDVTSKEIAYYMHVNHLKSVITSDSILSNNVHNQSSIEVLTSNFLSNLQPEFPSLNNAICKIGDKVKMENDKVLNKKLSNQTRVCQFCKEFSRHLYPYIVTDGFSNKEIAFNEYDYVDDENKCIGNPNDPRMPKSVDAVLLCYRCYNVLQPLIVVAIFSLAALVIKVRRKQVVLSRFSKTANSVFHPENILRKSEDFDHRRNKEENALLYPHPVYIDNECWGSEDEITTFDDFIQNHFPFDRFAVLIIKFLAHLRKTLR